MCVKHSTSLSRYQSTTRRLLVYHPFTGTFTGTSFCEKCPVNDGEMAFAIGVCLLTQQASNDGVIRRVHPVCARASGCSAQPRASGRNIFPPAVTSLLMLRRPAARAQAGAFRQERGCSLGAGEESSPAPSERNAKHEHNGKPHRHWKPRNHSAAHQSNHQAGKIPGSTAGMENRITSGMSHT